MKALHNTYSSKRRAGQTFAMWCVKNAAACVLPLRLDADVVRWIISVMESSGAMRGIEKNLKLRRTKLRFPTELEWEKATLTARVLFRTWEQGSVP